MMVDYEDIEMVASGLGGARICCIMTLTVSVDRVSEWQSVVV